MSEATDPGTPMLDTEVMNYHQRFRINPQDHPPVYDFAIDGFNPQPEPPPWDIDGLLPSF